MKTKLLMLSFAICGIANGQITITLNDMGTIGSTFIVADDSIVTTSAGSPGTNQTWNLTTLKNTRLDTTSIISPIGTPYASNYPGSNVVLLARNLYAYGFNDVNGSNTFGIAFGPFISGPYILIYNPPYKQLTFPATYSTSISGTTKVTGTFAYPVPPTDSMKTVSHINYISNIDGWGNVITPIATYASLRNIRINTHTDSTFVHNSSTGVWVWDGSAPTTNIDTLYLWFANNMKYPVAEIQIQQGLVKQGFYLLSSVTGVNEPVLNSDITIYPNPFNTSTLLKVNTVLKPENAELEIYDITGRKVKSQTLTPNKKECIIERGNMTEGMYFYKLTNNNEIIGTGKLMVE